MLHTSSRPRTTGRHRRPSALAAVVRAAVVTGSTAATALLATLPMAPVAAPVAAPAPTVTVTTPVVPLAVARPAALTFNPQAVAVTAPAAVRASALQRALGKIGARYSWGASGPNVFDCSGLVSWAYRSSGRALPHSSAAMSRIGTPVARSALQPGDLVFFYRGPSHVAIYVGNGKVVHASNPANPVGIASLNSMPFNSARRV